MDVPTETRKDKQGPVTWWTWPGATGLGNTDASQATVRTPHHQISTLCYLEDYAPRKAFPLV